MILLNKNLFHNLKIKQKNNTKIKFSYSFKLFNEFPKIKIAELQLSRIKNFQIKIILSVAFFSVFKMEITIKSFI
jgi:hypothetical protein